MENRRLSVVLLAIVCLLALPASSYAQYVGGAWWLNGLCIIEVDGNGNVTAVTNEYGDRQNAWQDGHTIHVPGWGDLVGQISGDLHDIYWSNDTAWTRPSPGPNVGGNWWFNGPCHVETDPFGQVAYVTNEWNDRQFAYQVGGTIVVPGWGGLNGTISQNEQYIFWHNDTTWSRGGPPPATRVFLINGSLDANPDWVQPGSAMSNAIGQTYGVTPEHWPWTNNSFLEVIPPEYVGIVFGGFLLADFLNGLPPGEVNLISHSHGGNVVLLSQMWSARPIRRYIQLATPVNWDFGGWRFALGYNVAGRCQASSTADWVQFSGASPYQVSNFAYAVYHSVAGAIDAFQALIAGDYEAASYWFAVSVFEALEADYWWDTTKREVEGPTLWFGGLGHGDLHEPPVWNAIAPWCA